MNKSYLYAAYYSLLVVFLGIGLWFLYRNVGVPDVQYRIVQLIAGGYVVWGVLFHWAKGDLHVKIVLEYLLIALLAVLLLRGVIL